MDFSPLIEWQQETEHKYIYPSWSIWFTAMFCDSLSALVLNFLPAYWQKFGQFILNEFPLIHSKVLNLFFETVVKWMMLDNW